MAFDNRSHRYVTSALAILFLSIALLSSCKHGGSAGSKDWWNSLPEQVFANVSKSVWAVQDKCGNVRGTAFVIQHGKDKYLITAQHVLHRYELDQLKFVRQETGASSAELRQEEIRDVKYVKRDDILDIAVLTGSNLNELPALELSPDQGRHIRVFAIGMAQAKDYFGISITEGIVANPQKAIMQNEVFGHLRHVEHTANLLPGNSGGPLVDTAGRVVGVNVIARGTGSLETFYASTLGPMFNGMDKTGAVQIKNTGMGRIKYITVTKFGAEPVPADLLPEDTGKVNGQSSIQFHLPEGRYVVTMETEEAEPAKREITVAQGQVEVVEYAFESSGFRFFNTSCELVPRLIVMHPFIATQYEASTDPQEQQRMVERTDVLGNNQLYPGQVWIEYYMPGTWYLGAYKIDPKRGPVAYTIPSPQTLASGEIKDIYIR